MKTANGFACIFKGEIDLRTVSATERAAKVNALAVGCGVMVMEGASDEVIEETFDRYALQYGLSVVPVTVTKNLN